MIGKALSVIGVCACCAQADVVTNVWATHESGDWLSEDAETGVYKNWEGGITNSAQLMHDAVADFPLGDAATINIKDVNIPCEGMIFRPYLEEPQEGEPLAADPWFTWYLKSESQDYNLAICTHSLGYFSLSVTDGWLVLGKNLYVMPGMPNRVVSYGPVRKQGNGYVRMSNFFRSSDSGHVFEIEDGKVFPMLPQALAYTDVRVTKPEGELVITNYSATTTLGAFTPQPGVPLELPGTELRMGMMATTVLPGEVCGSGKVTAVARTLYVTNVVPGITYGARAGRLRLDTKEPAARPFAQYDFETSLTADSSGNGRNLTSEGSVTRVYDEERNSYVARFTATASAGGMLKAVAADTDELTGDSDYTISLWAKAASPCANSFPTFITIGESQNLGQIIQFRFVDGTCEQLLLGHWDDRSDFINISPMPFESGWNAAEWHHYAAMRESGNYKLWVDGKCVLDKRDTGAVLNMSKPVKIGIGRFLSNATRCFHGDIDDVRIYSRSLGAGAAEALFAGRYPEQSGPLPTDGEQLAVPADTKLSLELNGEIQLAGTPTLAATNISVQGVRGTITMPEGGTLTMKGMGTFNGNVSGSNAFVKDGTEKLCIGGALKHTGGTEVKAGKLTLQNEATVLPYFAIYDFETGLGVDSGSAGLNLTANSEVTRVWDAERGGYVASFPGTTSQALSATVTSDVLTGNTDYTISVWAKYAAGCPDWGTLVSVGNQSSFKEIVFRYKGLSAGYMVLSHWGDTLDFVDIPVLANPQGTWHHFAATRKGNTYSIYCDGEKKWTETKECNLAFDRSKQICLGRQLASTDERRFFKGLLDDVHIYACALDDEQIVALGRGVRPVVVASGEHADANAALPKPVMHYAFEDSNEIGYDSAPGANHLTKVGSGSFTLIDSPLGGKALKFNNRNLAYLKSDAGISALPKKGKAYTLSFWAMTSDGDYSNGNAEASFVSWGDSGKINFMACYWYVDNGAFHGTSGMRQYIRKLDGSAIDFNFNDSVPGLREGEEANRWHHYVMVYDPKSGVKHYVDGQYLKEVNNGAYAFDTDTLTENTTFYLGVKPSNLKCAFDGALDEVKIFDEALDAAQVRILTRSDAGALRVLPEGGAVTIREGATLEVNGTDEVVGSLSGAGTLELTCGTVCITNGASSFDGELKGKGILRLPEGATLVLTQEPTDFDGYIEMAGGALALPQGCDFTGATFRPLVWNASESVSYPGAVEIADGTAIVLSASQKGPLVSTTGRVTVAGGGSVTLPAPKARGVWVIAHGSEAADAGEGELSERWTVTNLEGEANVKFLVTQSGDFVCRVNGADTTIFVR